MSEYVTDWQEITTVGTTVVPAPPGAVRADVVAIGGGGGGWSKYGTLTNGRGGGAGKWASGTIPVHGTVAVLVGHGGPSGSTDQEWTDRPSGGQSVVGDITAEGGMLRENGSNYIGLPAGTYSAFGQEFIGGGEAKGDGASAQSPGGGGSAYKQASVRPGARGQVWLRWWVNPKVENIYAGGVGKFTGSSSDPVKSGPCITAPH